MLLYFFSCRYHSSQNCTKFSLTDNLLSSSICVLFLAGPNLEQMFTYTIEAIVSLQGGYNTTGHYPSGTAAVFPLSFRSEGPIIRRCCCNVGVVQIHSESSTPIKKSRGHGCLSTDALGGFSRRTCNAELTAALMNCTETARAGSDERRSLSRLI